MPSLETNQSELRRCDSGLARTRFRACSFTGPALETTTPRTIRPMTKRTSKTSGLSRRQLLKAASGTAALLAAAKLNFPAGAFAQGAGPEVKGAKLGFIALTDATPLFVAKEKGIFAKY